MPYPITATDTYIEINVGGTKRRLLDFCGLPWDRACLDFHNTKRAVQTASAIQARQPIYATSIGLWRL